MIPNRPHTEPLFHFAYYDVRSVLPSGWDSDCLEVARNGGIVSSTAIDLDFEVPDSRPLRYRVTDGLSVRQALPWLWRLYERDFARLAAGFAGDQIELDPDPVSAINLNLITGDRESYEWHVDSNPITGLLFVTDHTNGEGELQFLSSTLGVVSTLRPKAGTFLLFDARQMPHAVEPVSDGVERLSVPMNYFRVSDRKDRPEQLNSHIYPE